MDQSDSCELSSTWIEAHGNEVLWTPHTKDGVERWFPHVIINRTDRFVYIGREPYPCAGYLGKQIRLDRAELERCGYAEGKWIGRSRRNFYTTAAMKLTERGDPIPIPDLTFPG